MVRTRCSLDTPHEVLILPHSSHALNAVMHWNLMLAWVGPGALQVAHDARLSYMATTALPLHSMH